MVEGPLGGPRPAASSNTALVFEFEGLMEVSDFGIEPVQGLLATARGIVVQRTRHSIKADYADPDELEVVIILQDDIIYQDEIDTIAGGVAQQIRDTHDVTLSRVGVTAT